MLAFVVVQGATVLQGAPPPAVMKADLITEQGARSHEAQPSVFPVETIVSAVFGPLAIAVFCYLLAKRTV